MPLLFFQPLPSLFFLYIIVSFFFPSVFLPLPFVSRGHRRTPATATPRLLRHPRPNHRPVTPTPPVLPPTAPSECCPVAHRPGGRTTYHHLTKTNRAKNGASVEKQTQLFPGTGRAHPRPYPCFRRFQCRVGVTLARAGPTMAPAALGHRGPSPLPLLGASYAPPPTSDG